MTRQPPTARQFYEAFVSAMGRSWTDPVFRETYGDAKAWTPSVINLLGRVGAEEFHYTDNEDSERSITTEYYRVDQCWFSYWPTEPDLKGSWSLDVAIEHENAKDQYRFEVRKLLALRCPLRVVIGYSGVADPEADPMPPGSIQRRTLEAWLRGPEGGTPGSSWGDGDFLLLLGKWVDSSTPPRWRGYMLRPEAPWITEPSLELGSEPSWSLGCVIGGTTLRPVSGILRGRGPS